MVLLCVWTTAWLYRFHVSPVVGEASRVQKRLVGVCGEISRVSDPTVCAFRGRTQASAFSALRVTKTIVVLSFTVATNVTLAKRTDLHTLGHLARSQV